MVLLNVAMLVLYSIPLVDNEIEFYSEVCIILCSIEFNYFEKKENFVSYQQLVNLDILISYYIFQENNHKLIVVLDYHYLFHQPYGEMYVDVLMHQNHVYDIFVHFLYDEFQARLV
jgi:hypothetical protein